MLSEQAPPLTLHHVLEDPEALRKDRAKVCCFLDSFFNWETECMHIKDYLRQILAALNAIHAGDLFHRGEYSTFFLMHIAKVFYTKGIKARCIGLVSSDHPTQTKQIKLGKVCYYTRLLDLHRSNEFGSKNVNIEEQQISEGW